MTTQAFNLSQLANNVNSSGVLLASGGGTGVTSTTGSGNAVLSSSPTLTGTPLAPTAAMNTSTTQIATTAFCNPASSLSGTGYVRLPSGLLLQWGNLTVGSSGSTISFPIAFTSFNQIQATADYGGPVIVTYAGLNNSGVSLYAWWGPSGAGVSSDVSWHAIGY